jgi:pyridoxine 4-dehydrogenase
VDNCIRALRGTKRIDLYESARVDHNIPVRRTRAEDWAWQPHIPQIEEAMKTMSALRDEGKFDFIGLSECSAETVRRASKVCAAILSCSPRRPVQVATISGVEIEVSPLSYEDETKKGRSEACPHWCHAHGRQSSPPAGS